MLGIDVRLYLVRHAKAAPGDPDELRPLTPEGREEARRLAERLAAERPDAVVTSPLLRARETAEVLARACGLEAVPDERLAPGATSLDARTRPPSAASGSSSSATSPISAGSRPRSPAARSLRSRRPAWP